MERIILKKTFGITVWAGLSLAIVLFVSQAGAQTNVAFYNPSPLSASGLQTGGSYPSGGPFALGLEFSVNTKPITITALGAFDSTIGTVSPSGFGSIVYVGIYNEATSAFIGDTASFLGTAGSSVVDSYRFETINALTLNVGTYIVIASGYGIPSAPDWNAIIAGQSSTGTSPIVFDNGNGDLTLVNNLYDNDNSGQLERTTSPGNNGASALPYGAVFGAASFEYAVPEPSATELALVGTAVLGAVRFGRRFLRS
jgi:hypothetical protein